MKRRRKPLAKNQNQSVGSALAAALGLTLLVYLLPLGLVLPQAKGASLGEEAAVSAVQTVMEAEAASTSQPAPEPEAKEQPKQEPPNEPTKKQKKTDQKQEKTAITLRCLLDGEVQELELEDYLWGVVAAEMPAAFHQEALCAQAVAARTYTVYRMANPTPNHPEADICGDPGCCQAWISREERLNDWTKSERKACEKKINKAIRKTAGQALYYDDTPIMAAFHAASAGSTKSAQEVWGEEYPYLQEVPSPEDDASVPNYYSTVTLSKEAFSSIFLDAYPKAVLDGDGSSWFGKVKYDKAGLPVSLSVGGVTVDTGQMRTLYELRSASFSVECEGDNVTFYVTGYGHGVGMSQYGANALAKQGKKFQEILQWYYPGTELKQVK